MVVTPAPVNLTDACLALLLNGLYGTGEIDAIASYNDPSHPMLFMFAHDGDNAWSGGFSYWYENVTQFSHSAASQGYEPTVVAEYLADHPIEWSDVVHVEDGGWVNADGDFGSPQYINWNWPLYGATGEFDIENGWAVDERNWAVLTGAHNRVEPAEAQAWKPELSNPDAPPCPECGALMARNGSCYVCLNCGATTGCS